MDTAHPVVSALAIRDGRIIAAGSDSAILGEFCGLMPGQDLKGKTVLPGLIDAHIHMQHYALNLNKVDCETAARADCLARVAERARQAKPGDWVLGHGWNQNIWPEGFGSAADLDAISPENPVFLTAKSLHAAWANTTALRQASLRDDSPDPPDGSLGRDPDGHLNGILFESTMELVSAVTPEPSLEELAGKIRIAQQALWRMGVTGVHDFDRRSCFQALQILHERGELRLRVLKSIPMDDLPYAAGLGLRTGFGDDWLRIGGVKIFADGALGPQTAAMLQPYGGSGDNRGFLFMDAEELFEHGRLAVENGLSIAVHAIGDRANHEVLDAIDQLRRYEAEQLSPPSGNRRSRLRHRIEHVQLIHPEDAGRLAALGIVASMQPVHATSDMEMADRYWGERADYSYAWKLQIDHGAVLAFGSDAPVESPNPFWGFHAAVTRSRRDGNPGPEGWIPAQKLSLQQAIEAYTLGAAYAAGWEDRQGKLAPGYFGDLILLDRDPFEIPSEEIYSITPLATMLGGEWVFRR